MGKKRKGRLLLSSGISESPGGETEETEKRIPKDEAEVFHILEQRLGDRVIPLVDDGISERDIKNPTPEVAENWYKEAHVGKYVHMEVVTRDGYSFPTKRIQFEFSRMLAGYDDNLDERGVNPAIDRFTFATMSKLAFINNITNPLRYINYFIEYYDDDDELMRAYFMVMFHIMLEDIDLEPSAFIELIHAAFTTDSLVEKLHRMIEHNVDKRQITDVGQKYDESIQLTVEHLKAILGVSCLLKFTIPLVSHYFSTKNRLLEEAGISDKKLYYYVFGQLLSAFDDVYDINLYNKLYHTATSRVGKTTNSESGMWARRERVGVTPVSYAHDLVMDLVTDILQKAVFSKSSITFIHVSIDKAIYYTLIQADKHEFVEMQMVSSDSVNETVSKWDRWQADKSAHSQRDRIRSYVSVRESLERFGLEFDLDFRKMRSKKPKDIKASRALREEYEYYRDSIHRPLNDTQYHYIQLYYDSLIGNTVDVKAMEFSDIVKVIMIMKRDFDRRNFVYFPLFISSQVNTTAGKKYSKKRVEKLVKIHPLYPDLVAEYRDVEGLVNIDKEYDEIRTLISCPIVIVDHEHDDVDGMLMWPQDIPVVDEVMRFYKSL